MNSVGQVVYSRLALLEDIVGDFSESWFTRSQILGPSPNSWAPRLLMGKKGATPGDYVEDRPKRPF